MGWGNFFGPHFGVWWGVVGVGWCPPRLLGGKQAEQHMISERERECKTEEQEREREREREEKKKGGRDNNERAKLKE